MVDAQPHPNPEPRTVDAGRAIEWFVSGWRLFMRNPGVWIAIAFILFIVLLALSAIPILGQIAVLVTLPVAGGGLVLGCHALEAGGELRVDHLFEGFTRFGAQLFVVGALYAAGGLLAIGVALLIGSGGAIGGAISQGWPGAGMALGGLAMGGLVYFALSVLLGMAVWFAPSLVVLRTVAPFDAMKTSLAACTRNFVPFLVFSILATIGGFVAMLPAGLGLIIFVPVLAGAAYASYRDVFD